MGQFEDLVKKRQKYVDASEENNFDIDSILSGLYDDPSHFIYEILQNAEDAKAKNVEFTLLQDKLEIRHDGNDFVFKDVDGITGIGISTKKDDINAIGKFGVGFKSVFAITQTPVIYSGKYHFQIDKFVVPVSINHPHQTQDTLIVLPFNHCDRTNEEIYDLIKRKLEDIGLKTLLFLKNIEAIDWKTLDNSGQYYKESKPYKSKKNLFKVTAISISDTGDAFEEYLIIRKYLSINDGRRTIEIAYRIETDEENKIKIIPETQSKLVVYFPTEKDIYLNFLIQGPYKTTPNRENIPLDDEGNIHILNETAILVSESISLIKEVGLLNVDFLKVLPINADHREKSPIYSTIYDCVKERLLSEEAFLPAADGKHSTSSQAVLARGQGLIGYLKEKDLQQLFGRKVWLSPEITSDKTRELRDYLLKELDVKEVGGEDFRRSLSREYLIAQTDEWMIDFYCKLKDRQLLFRPKKGTISEGILRRKPIVRLQDNSHIPLFNGDGVIQVYFPAESQSQYKTIKKSLIKNEDAVAFFKQAGVESPDLYSEIIEFVFPKYKGDEIEISNEEYFSDIKKIYNTYNNISDDKKKKLCEELKGLAIIDSCNNEEDKPFLRDSETIYYPTPELLNYFSNCNDAYFITKELIEVLGPDPLPFLKDIGVNYVPRKIECEPSISAEGKRELRRGSGKTLSLQDYTIHGLSECLENINQETSKLLWNYLIETIKNLTNWQIDTFFRGEYRWFYYSSHSAHFDASFLKILREREWLYDKDKAVKSPRQLLISDLADDYEIDETCTEVLKKKFHFMPDIADQLPDEEKEKLSLVKAFSAEQLRELVSSIKPTPPTPDPDDDWEPKCDPEDIDPKDEIYDGQKNSFGENHNPIDDLTNNTTGNKDPKNPPEKTKPVSQAKRDKIADWGEGYVYRLLRKKYSKFGTPEETDKGFIVSNEDNTYEIIWLNKNKKIGKGCDFLVKINDNCEFYIEVKSKEGEDKELLRITGRQWSLARALNKRGIGERYWIYVVNNVGKDTAKIIKICDPIEKWKDGLLYAHPINLKL